MLFVLVLPVALSLAGQQPPTARSGVAVEPIAAILDAFRTHDIVALGEPHGNEQGHAFRLSLIRDLRFAETVNDILWECGSARYQDIMDRFIQGEDVPDTSLRQAWRNTVGSINVACDLPIYEEFIRAVRAVNAARPRERQLRVLLGDPPIDWEKVHALEDAVKWAAVRDIHAAEVIKTEVLSKHRRALIIYGDMHLRRKYVGANYMTEDPVTKTPVDGRTLTEQLEAATGTRVFAIWVDTTSDLTKLQADIASWPTPSMTLLRGTVLGATDFAFYYPTSRDPARPMEDKFDALLYLGPPSTMSQARLSPTLCADRAYMEMRLGRMALVGVPTDSLKRYCATVAK
ncbi:MAG: hypothetical protein DMF91_21960 [Acidobacteria bacterium]|nr:MAG: hypothetical protein DMF91_21960 [Acidobacteriota bacterium]